MLKEITIRNGNAKESRVPTRDTMFQMAMACQDEFKGAKQRENTLKCSNNEMTNKWCGGLKKLEISIASAQEG